MAQRRAVFQSKVLQKLYPSAREQSPAHAVAKREQVKGRGEASGDAVNRRSAASPGRRLYTVLPPPADYHVQSEDPASLSQLNGVNSEEEPAEEHVHESDEEQRRRRRRRKKKASLHQDSGNDEAASGSESSTAQTVREGAERISRNKKRKLKKKRHKEKLLSMGLMPRATALDFTYRSAGEEGTRRAAEVSDFLRTTMETFLSDSSPRAATAPHLSAAVEDLLGSIDSGRTPDSVLRQLYRLKTFVQQTDSEQLEKALTELSSSSCMSAEETTAVATLLQYWITDVLPMQGGERAAPSAARP